MDGEEPALNEISRRIIGCAMTVSNGLGCGFLEKVYENACAHEMRLSGLTVDQQADAVVWYSGIAVGRWSARVT